MLRVIGYWLLGDKKLRAKREELRGRLRGPPAFAKASVLAKATTVTSRRGRQDSGTAGPRG
jgi:hypothetical protein